MDETITVKDFVDLLCPICHDNLLCPFCHNVISCGRKKGWLEDEDERFSKKILNRRTAARIIHSFMKIELGIKDLEDISAAEKLQDLYTCRVCANHIAQVYCGKIMEAQEIMHCGQIVQIFNHLAPVSKEECQKIISFLNS